MEKVIVGLIVGLAVVCLAKRYLDAFYRQRVLSANIYEAVSSTDGIASQ